MACALTQGYNLDCRGSVGGIRTVYVMEFDNATTITAAAGVVTGITKAATKKFYKYNLIMNTAEAEDTLTGNRENGTLFSAQMLKFPINKMTVAVRNELLLLAKNRLLFVVVDENGSAWLYGKDYGLMLTTAAGKTGKAKADRNGYELSFEGEERELAHSVDNTTLGTLETPGT